MDTHADTHTAAVCDHLGCIIVTATFRTNRQHRRRRGKSDPADSEAAARSVLAGDATGSPKDHTGGVEAVRVLNIAGRSAVKAKTQAANQIRDLVVTAPDDRRRSVATRDLAASNEHSPADSTASSPTIFKIAPASSPPKRAPPGLDPREPEPAQ